MIRHANQLQLWLPVAVILLSTAGLLSVADEQRHRLREFDIREFMRLFGVEFRFANGQINPDREERSLSFQHERTVRALCRTDL